MKLIQEAMSPEIQAAIALARGERRAAEPVRFGMGGGCSPARYPPNVPPGTSHCPPPPARPDCTDNRRICDMDRIGNTVVVAGGSVFEMRIAPTQVKWFQPKAVKATITDLGHSDLSHRVMFTSVEINDIPQLSVNVKDPEAPAAPVAPATQGGSISGFWSDDWTDPDDFAVKVPWGWISIATELNILTIKGIALGLPSTTNALVSVSIYGNGSSVGPGDMDPRDAARPNYS